MEQKGICREVGEISNVIFRNRRSVEGGRIIYGSAAEYCWWCEVIPKLYQRDIRV